MRFKEVTFSFNGGKDSTVLLHLLRAGYYLHQDNTESTKGDELSCIQNCPIRTIYFESPCAFPEIDSFTFDTASMYGLQLERIQSDFKSGLEELMKERPTKAIFIGTRIGDPNAIGQEQFSLSLHPFFTPLKLLAPVSGLDRVTWPATERRYADDNLIYEIPCYVMILSAECGCGTWEDVNLVFAPPPGRILLLSLSTLSSPYPFRPKLRQRR